MAESEAVMKVEDTSAASKATEPTPSKKDGDAETENIEELEMKGLKIVENVDDIVDEPGHIKPCACAPRESSLIRTRRW